MPVKSRTHQLGSTFVVFGLAAMVLGLLAMLVYADGGSAVLYCGGGGLVLLLVGFILRVLG